MAKRSVLTETVVVGRLRVGDDGAVAFRLDRQQWLDGEPYGPVRHDRGVVRAGDNLIEYHPDIAKAARAEWKKMAKKD